MSSSKSSMRQRAARSQPFSGRQNSRAARRNLAVSNAVLPLERRVLFAAFSPGDLVLYQVGSGSGALSSASAPVYLDEYSTAGSIVQSIPVPTTAGGGNNPFTASGTGSNEGSLTLSENGQNLLFTGYDAGTGVSGIASTGTSAGATGTVTKFNTSNDAFTTSSTAVMTNGDPITISNLTGTTLSPAQSPYYVKVVSTTTFALYTTSALTTVVTGTGSGSVTVTGSWSDANVPAVQREVGVVSSSGTVTTDTTLGANLSGQSIYSAASVDGTSGVYVSGGNGVYYTTIGSTSTPTAINASQGAYMVEINNGQLYVCPTSGSQPVETVGSGLPTSSGQTFSLLPGEVFSGTSGDGVGYSREFAFATLNGGSTPDTLYIADNYNDGVDKMSLVNGSWTINGEIGAFGADGNPLSGITGLAVQPVPGGEQLFFTTSSKLYTITDPYGYDSVGGTAGTQGGGIFSGSPPVTVIATAPTNEAFRGLSWVPQPGGAPTMFQQPTSINAVTGTTATLTSLAYGTNVSVQWTVSTDGGMTYSNISGATYTTLSIPNVSTSGYMYEAVFTNASGSITSAPATVTVVPGPQFSFTASTTTVPSTIGTVTINVQRLGDTSQDDMVSYQTSNGTAVAGTNYTATSGTLDFPANSTATDTITVPISYVSAQSSTLLFNVTLSNITGANAANASFGVVTESVSILTPQESITLSNPTYSVDDTNTDAIVSVLRGGTVSSDAGTVAYNVSGAITTSGTVSFAAGQVVSAITIPLNGLTGPGSFNVSLGAVSQFTTGGAVLGKSNTSTAVTVVHAATDNITGTAASVTDIETSGPYGQSYAPVVGDVNAGTGSFAYLAYEVLEFSPASAPNLYPVPGTTVNNAGIGSLSLQMYNTDNSGSDNYSGHVGNFNVYFLPDSDTTTATSSLTFSTGSAPTGLANSQFKVAPVLLGTFSFDNPGGYETYTPSSIPASVETALVNDLNSGSNFRLAVTPETYGGGAIAVDWRGLFTSQTPIISFKAAETVNQTPEYISFQSSSYSVNESSGTAVITLTRTGTNIGDTASINYTVGGGNAIPGVNYTPVSGTANFSAGSATTSFSVPILDAVPQGGNKILSLTISTPKTGTPATTIGALASPTTATLTILDNSTLATETLTSSIDDAADVEVDGPYTDAYVKATTISSDYPSFGVLDFTDSTPANTIMAIDSITLTVTNEPTVAAGNVDIYLVSDATSNVLPGTPQSPNPHYYNASAGIEGVGNQFGAKYLLGSYTLTDTTGGDVLNIPLDGYNPAAEYALISYLNSGSEFRIVITPEDNNVLAEWVSTSASISITVQDSLNLPAWISAPNGAAAWDGTDLNVYGPATIIADPQASGDNPVITVTGSGDLSITPASGTEVHIASLAVMNGGTAAVTATTGTPEVLLIGAANGLSLAPGGKLDLANNFLDVAQGNLSSIDGWISSGALSSSTVTASQAAGNYLTTLGAIENQTDSGTQLYATFDGATASSTDVLVRMTYYGDANLDGKVDASDYSLIDNGYLSNLTGWYNGDFNYDGVINGSDYTLIDNAFNVQGSPFVGPTDQIAAAGSTGRLTAVAAPINTTSTDSDDLFSKKKVTSSLIAELEDLITAG